MFILQRFAAFFEIYKIDILLHRSKLNFFCKKSSTILRNWILNWTIIQSKFSSKLLFLSQILMKFCRNFANVLKNIRNRWHVQKFAKFWEISANFPRNCAKIQYYSILFNPVLSAEQFVIRIFRVLPAREGRGCARAGREQLLARRRAGPRGVLFFLS